MKKLISAILICCMVLPMFPASATEEATAQPTIEEILNSYHEKAFEAQTAAENGGASTYARGGSSQTLEQETVDELTDAGYEAYNVTGENYEELEETLGTDFASLGLASDSSYIVVISGEDPATQSNPNARVIDPPTYDNFDGDNGGGSSSFTYTQGETTYTMRYVTIVGTTPSSELWVDADFTLSNINIGATIWEYISNVAIQVIVNWGIEQIEKIDPRIAVICNLGTIVFGEAGTLDFTPYEALDPDSIVLESDSAWTRSYIQIYNQSSGLWHTAQCSSYVVSKLEIEGQEFFDSNTGSFGEIGGIECITTNYSPYYNNSSTRMARAVEGYRLGTKLHDYTGDLEFEFIIPPSISGLPGYTQLVFTHRENRSYLLPLIQEE